MFDLMSEPGRHRSPWKRQIQYLNNFRIAHRRTEYEDARTIPRLW